MLDTYKHKGLRKKMVDGLREKGIESERVLKAMMEVPRHLFLDSSLFDKIAYEDKAFPIGENQTISHPYTVAYQTQLLDVQRGEKILEVGTGSGYQSSILEALGAKVFSVERQRKLYIKTKKKLEDRTSSVRLFYGDGYLGLSSYAPFDKILVTCGAPFIPDALVAQLVNGGKLVIPIGEDVQKMICLEKKNDLDFEIKEYDFFRFVPMLEKKNA